MLTVQSELHFDTVILTPDNCLRVLLIRTVLRVSVKACNNISITERMEKRQAKSDVHVI